MPILRPGLNPVVIQKTAQAVGKEVKRELKELKTELNEVKETVQGWGTKVKDANDRLKQKVGDKILDAACENWTASSSKCE